MRSLRHILLALAASATVAAALAPVASAAPTGSITGTVVAATGKQPIAGVRVCAVSEFGFEEEETSCTLTAADGTYGIGGLPEERYRVEFLPGVEGLNYVVQYWKGKLERFEANLVRVEAGEVSGIDAELVEGGEIAGHVTRFGGGAPLTGIEVCAESFGLVFSDGCDTTGPNGEYLIVGLADGRYAVEFRPPEDSDLLSQYYDAEPGLLQSDKVKVTAGQLIPNVDAALLEGGRIGGTITDGVTDLPLTASVACTIPTLGERYGSPCGETDATGRYLIRKVPAGAYRIQFYGPEGYSGGHYRGVCGGNEVLVTVSPGLLTGGIDAGLFPSNFLNNPGPPPCETVVEMPAKPMLKKCRKGFKLKKVKGKKRCVKVRRHRHRKRHTAHL